MMCIIVPHLVLAIVGAVLLCIGYSWPVGALLPSDGKQGVGVSLKEWHHSFYDKSLMVFACLLAVMSVVKSVIFALFSCPKRCRMCGVIY